MTLAFADLDSIAEARRAAERAYEAWQVFRTWDPADVDRVVEAMARAIAPEAARLGELAAQETGYGNAGDKALKNLFNTIAVSDWLRNVKTLGVLWRDEATKVVAIGEPMGVVAALIPVTNPTSTVIFKTLSAVKAGNAVVHAPHPRGRHCGAETTRVLAEAAEDLGAPAGLIQCLSGSSLDGTRELMSHHRTAVVMATGGSAMVRTAYSSGKPTLAVGPGNVPVYVDRSKARDLDEVADMILSSKSFDYGTACAAEQAVIADRQVAEPLRRAIREQGGHICTAREAGSLAQVLFDRNLNYRVENVGQSASRLAQLSGFDVPPRTRVLLAELDAVGRTHPLSAEKLDPVLAFYEVDSHEAGFERALEVLRFGGEGHTAVLHAGDPSVVARFARLPAGRVLVNTPALHGGMGFSCDIDPSFMLGTGTWSGSIVSDNVTALHLINIKRIAYESRPWRSLNDLLEGEGS
jgi:acyl-CoA reductase-like NAD-dependent aldehyde dehydrogenase